jgi:hypothetical protein
MPVPDRQRPTHEVITIEAPTSADPPPPPKIVRGISAGMNRVSRAVDLTQVTPCGRERTT